MHCLKFSDHLFERSSGITLSQSWLVIHDIWRIIWQGGTMVGNLEKLLEDSQFKRISPKLLREVSLN